MYSKHWKFTRTQELNVSTVTRLKIQFVVSAGYADNARPASADGACALRTATLTQLSAFKREICHSEYTSAVRERDSPVLTYACKVCMREPQYLSFFSKRAHTLLETRRSFPDLRLRVTPRSVKLASAFD
jgi:hypothetical protein